MQKLPLEIEFQIASFNSQVDGLNLGDAKVLLKELFRHHVITKLYYFSLLEKYWLPGGKDADS